MVIVLSSQNVLYDLENGTMVHPSRFFMVREHLRQPASVQNAAGTVL
jgi:hypothetical protein